MSFKDRPVMLLNRKHNFFIEEVYETSSTAVRKRLRNRSRLGDPIKFNLAGERRESTLAGFTRLISGITKARL